MRMTAAARAVGSAVLAAALFAMTAPHSARADDGAIMVSPDGATWSTNLPGSLFPAASRLIPGASDVTTFWVRNTTNDPGYLRVTLTNSVTSDPLYADALTVAVGIPSHSGQATSLSAAGDCTVLLTGDVVPANSQVPVTVTMKLGDLTGKQGQSAWNTFSVGVALSQLRPDDSSCAIPDVSIPGTAPTPALAASTPTGTGTGTGTGIAQSVAPGPAAQQPSEPDISKLEGILVDANTGRFTDAYVIIMLLIAFGLGAGWFILGARRARRREMQEGGAVE